MTERVKQLYLDCSVLPREEWRAFAEANCAGAAEQQHLLSLLDASEHAGTFLEGIVLQAASAALESEPALPELGPYRAVEVLGSGGMGVVYLAERADGQVEKQVAVKLMHPGLETTSLRERFLRERQILARLSHPGIAQLIDAGLAPDGRPWFAMELVEGTPIDRFCDENRLSTRQRVELFLEVLDAAAHAHRHLTVHRDLKPSNISVTAEGRPKLLDFGISVALDETRSTESTARLFTPRYAAPEQIRGEPPTAATDIFQLGGVLFTLLAGQPPHSVPADAPLAELERAICGQDAPLLRSLRPEIDRDLENITAMALRRPPERRYSSVALFARDLRDCLAGAPVTATPDSKAYRLRRFLSRHWIPASAAVFCVLALTAGLGATLYQARLARRHFQEVRALANTFLFEIEDAIHDVPGATKGRKLVIETGQKYLDLLYAENPSDRGLMTELAVAYDRLAKLQSGFFAANTGETGLAIENYKKSIALRRQLGEPRSADMKVRRAYGRLNGTLASALSEAQRSAEAEPYAAAAVENAQEMLRLAPTSEDALAAASTSFQTQSQVMVSLNEFEAAEEALRKGLAIVPAYEKIRPGDRANRVRESNTLFNLSQVRQLAGNLKGAAADARRSFEILEAVNRVKSTPQTCRLEFLARAVHGEALGHLEPVTPETLSAAVEQLRIAAAASGERARKDPANHLAFLDDQLVRGKLGGLLADRHHPDAAAVIEKTKSELLDRLHKVPDDFNSQKMLADAHSALSAALLESSPRRAAGESLASLTISDRILADSPRDAVSNKAKIVALLGLARARLAAGQRSEAEAALESARRQLAYLAQLSPADQSLRGLGEQLANLTARASRK